MALSFQPYVDKENSGVLGTQPLKGGLSNSVRAGKVFGGNSQSLVTPRKALGDVNKDLKANPSKGPGLKPLNPQALKPKQIPVNQGLQLKNVNSKVPLSSKSGNIQISQDSGVNRKKKIAPPSVVTKQKTVVSNIKPVEDREKMFIYKDEPDDDFEDIWPKSERISTYIHKLITWRPPCLFGDIVSGSEDEEDEDSEEAFRRRLEENDRILELSLPKHDMQEENTIRDEDLFVLDSFEDIPLPSLDDSINIIPNTAKLQIQD